MYYGKKLADRRSHHKPYSRRIDYVRETYAKKVAQEAALDVVDKEEVALVS